jgi:hypothetical protein
LGDLLCIAVGDIQPLGEGDKQLMIDANLKYYDKPIALPDMEIVQYQ